MLFRFPILCFAFVSVPSRKVCIQVSARFVLMDFYAGLIHTKERHEFMIRVHGESRAHSSYFFRLQAVYEIQLNRKGNKKVRNSGISISLIVIA